MNHDISDYSESDLTVALASPFNSLERQADIIFEILHRKQQNEMETLGLLPLTAS